MTTDVATGTLIFEPIPSGELEKIRAAGMDEAGNRLVSRVDAEGGNPLRCCLRENRRWLRLLQLPGAARV